MPVGDGRGMSFEIPISGLPVGLVLGMALTWMVKQSVETWKIYHEGREARAKAKEREGAVEEQVKRHQKRREKRATELILIVVIMRE